MNYAPSTECHPLLPLMAFTSSHLHTCAPTPFLVSNVFQWFPWRRMMFGLCRLASGTVARAPDAWRQSSHLICKGLIHTFA